MNLIRIADCRLTENFRLYEFLRSDTAERLKIDNTPDDTILVALQALAERLEAVQSALSEKRMDISSGYRCPLLNAAVGSRPTSDHVKGLAADFTAPGFGTPADVCHRLVSSDIPFKQLILEGPGRRPDGTLRIWVHISFDLQAELQRRTAKREVLTIGRGGAVLVGIRDDALA